MAMRLKPAVSSRVARVADGGIAKDENKYIYIFMYTIRRV